MKKYYIKNDVILDENGNHANSFVYYSFKKYGGLFISFLNENDSKMQGKRFDEVELDFQAWRQSIIERAML